MKKTGHLLSLAAVLLLTGCGGRSASDENGAAWRNDVSTQSLVEAAAAELGDDYWANAELAPEYLDDWYGISDDMYEEYYGQTPMISVNVDTLIVVKTEEDHVEDVQNAFGTYKESMSQDSMQYPINLSKIQASEIRTFGNYVCFVQLGADAANTSSSDEEAVEKCQEMNERALAVIEKELTK